MYIGPWQEYKLAKLIQASTQRVLVPADGDTEPTPHVDTSLSVPRARQQIDRVCSPTGASVRSVSDSSTATGISTASAPSRMAQAKLDDLFYNAAYANTSPSSASGSASSSIRQPRVLIHRVPAGSKLRAAPKGRAKGTAKSTIDKMSPEGERRARIAHMQRLYGLAPPPVSEGPSAAALLSSGAGLTGPGYAAASVDRHASVSQALRPQPAHDTARSTNSGTSFQSVRLRMALVEAGDASAAKKMMHEGAANDQSPTPKDPLNLSMTSLGGTDAEDLIAWSKMLQPDVVPEAPSLSSLF